MVQIEMKSNENEGSMQVEGGGMSTMHPLHLE